MSRGAPTAGRTVAAYFAGQLARAYLEGPEDVRAYLTTFDRLRSDALSPQASAELIESIVEG